MTKIDLCSGNTLKKILKNNIIDELQKASRGFKITSLQEKRIKKKTLKQNFNKIVTKCNDYIITNK